MEQITSRKNPLLVQIRKLTANRAFRRQCGQFLGDGGKLLEEALKWNAPLTAVVVTEGTATPELPEGVRLVEVPRDVMASVSPMEAPQGVLFLCEQPKMEAPELLPAGKYLVLDGLQDPGNVGTVIRTANALGMDAVILTGACASVFGAKTARASMGALFRQTVLELSLTELQALLKKNGLKLYGAALSDRAQDVRKVSLHHGAVAIGSEGHGLSGELLQICDGEIIIPMQPGSESLNAGVAAAILMWELAKTE